jgi:DNA-directed RNA polymerase specialized sigma24 family protein
LDRYVGAQENGTCLADVVPDQGSLLDSPVSYCDKQELNAAETEFIASLSPFEHRIFLEHLEGLSLRSIAEKHGCGVKKVRVSLGHCLTLGRKIFKKHGITDVSL